MDGSYKQFSIIITLPTNMQYTVVDYHKVQKQL